LEDKKRTYNKMINRNTRKMEKTVEIKEMMCIKYLDKKDSIV
jgi:hypothetical protein